jgi:hypothetical protein
MPDVRFITDSEIKILTWLQNLLLLKTSSSIINRVKATEGVRRSDSAERFSVILVNPEHPENVGLVARSMKNTGFKHLRIVRGEELIPGSYVTAVHAEDILENAQFFPDLERATRDLDAVFAATAKMRKNFSVLSLDEAVDRMLGLPSTTRLGLVFGNRIDISGSPPFQFRIHDSSGKAAAFLQPWIGGAAHPVLHLYRRMYRSDRGAKSKASLAERAGRLHTRDPGQAGEGAVHP